MTREPAPDVHSESLKAVLKVLLVPISGTNGCKPAVLSPFTPGAPRQDLCSPHGVWIQGQDRFPVPAKRPTSGAAGTRRGVWGPGGTGPRVAAQGAVGPAALPPHPSHRLVQQQTSDTQSEGVLWPPAWAPEHVASGPCSCPQAPRGPPILPVRPLLRVTLARPKHDSRTTQPGRATHEALKTDPFFLQA